MTKAKKLFSVRISLLMLSALLWVTACSSPTHQLITNHSNITSTRFPKIARAHVVKHMMGETQVPDHPQRVVVLHPSLFEAAFALGVKPLAAPKFAVLELQRLLGKLENFEDVENVNFESPNLEKLLRLKPDLILGFSSHQNIYPLLSHIAPTVLATIDPVTNWKGFLVITARALGKTELAQQILADYYARLAQFKAQMSQAGKNPVVSVVQLRADGLFLLEPASFAGVILLDAGVKRPPNQLFAPQVSIRLGGAALVLPLSQELLAQIDTDVLFLFVLDVISNKDLTPKVQELKASPLWSKLKVVQLHKVHEVGFYWIGLGPITANRVIDDLFRYLVNK